MIETKVRNSSAAAYLGMAALLGILEAAESGNLISGLPGWMATLFAPLLPALITFAVGYLSRHTRRDDDDV